MCKALSRLISALSQKTENCLLRKLTDCRALLYVYTMGNRSLLRQVTLRYSGFLAALCVAPLALAEGHRTAVATIHHAFATELGTGVYDIGGQSIFVVRVAPEIALRKAGERQPGVRLLLPMAAGSFDFNPLDGLEPDVPERIDSFSLMPGLAFDFPRGDGWRLTPWLRAGASFSDGHSDGRLLGAGLRLAWTGPLQGFEVDRVHELVLAAVDYRGDVPSDRFLRFRNGLDVRRATVRLTPNRRLLAGVYAIADVVTDPPQVPLEAGEQSMMQMELGVTFNTEPRPRIGRWRWPRLGFGYRLAGDFSGWRIVVGAPF